MVLVQVSAAEKGFVEEMRFAALKMHTKEETKEGEREAEGPPISKWDPKLEGYLKFLVDSKLVYDILETVLDKAVFSEYVELRSTGLERSESLAKDLEWFKQQGHNIPQQSSVGIKYAQYLEELSEKDPQAFICHFYMIYFGHTAGGTMIGRKVEKKLLKGKKLEFYKYNGELPEILQNIRDKINRVGEKWSRKEKDHCLEETEKAIMVYGDILRLILS
ncbi:hypothetical protein ACS0TY_021361 [Phlomoides rotata]